MSKRLIIGALNGIKSIISSDFVASIRGADALRCAERISKLFDYTVIGGKCMRSRLMLSTYNAVDRKASSGALDEVVKVAACMELLQAYLLIIDDIMDRSTTRRGKPCWHTLDDVGLGGVNDALVLECAIDRLIQMTISRHPYSSAIMNAFANTKRTTVMGQMLDNSTCGLEDCSWERYTNIVRHKTSYYTMFAPVQIGLLLADERRFSKEVKQLCFKLGYLFQAQDDFLDCFGDPAVTGKNGTDLKDGKCTWVTCKATEKLAKPSFTKYVATFRSNFGQASTDSVNILKQILSSLKIDDDFLLFEKEYGDVLVRDIDSFPHDGLRSVFRQYLGENLHRAA